MDTVKYFLSFVEEECRKNKVKLIVSKESHVEAGGVFCNGYFSDQGTPTLAIATGKDQKLWLPILVHEYGHMTQWLEKAEVWEKNRIGKMESMDFIDLWLSDKIELSEDQKDNYFSRSILVEKDCEERTVKNIKKFNLPIDTVDYTKRANSYILFYHIVRKCRRWYQPHKEPYNLSYVYSAMPEDFNLDYLTLSPELEEVLLQCFV